MSLTNINLYLLITLMFFKQYLKHMYTLLLMYLLCFNVGYILPTLPNARPCALL